MKRFEKGAREAHRSRPDSGRGAKRAAGTVRGSRAEAARARLPVPDAQFGALPASPMAIARFWGLVSAGSLGLAGPCPAAGSADAMSRAVGVRPLRGFTRSGSAAPATTPGSCSSHFKLGCWVLSWHKSR